MTVTNFTKPTPIVVDLISELKPGDALDIGAGNGRNSLYLAENGWVVDALAGAVGSNLLSGIKSLLNQ